MGGAGGAGGNGGDGGAGGAGGDAQGGGIYVAAGSYSIDGTGFSGTALAGSAGSGGVPGAWGSGGVGGAGVPAGAGGLPGKRGNAPGAGLAGIASDQDSFFDPAATTGSPAPATQLRFATPMPPTVVGGQTFPDTLWVVATDAAGNIDPNFSDTVTIAMGTNPGAATLSGLLTWPANSGVVQFSGLSLQKHADDTTASGGGTDGIYTLEASTATLGPGTTNGFTVLGYTPDQIRAAYGINALSLTGTGETIAIVAVQNDPNLLSDVNAFDAAFNLSSYGLASSFLTVYDQNGKVIDPTSTNVPTDLSGANAGEEALDVEWATRSLPAPRSTWWKPTAGSSTTRRRAPPAMR